MKTHILKTSLILLPLSLGVAAFAQMGGDNAPSAASASSDMSNASPNQDNVSHADRSFAYKLAMGSTNEVALSQLADSHASNPDVKSFAQMMVTDHNQLNADLSALAMKKGVDISESVQKGQKKGVASMEKKSGADFDKAYIKQMVKDHKSTADLLKDEARDTKDQDFAALANKALPIVLQHLQKAQEIERGL